MTPQQVFNKVVKHLRQQGRKTPKRSFDGKQLCQYHAKDGTKCAVGCLITKREYKHEMEGHPLSSLIDPRFDSYSSVLKAKIGSNFYLAYDLQAIHDNYPARDWEKQFAILAEEYQLTLPKK